MTLFVNYANGGLQSPAEPNDEADTVDRENGERLFLTLSFGPLEGGHDASEVELLQTSLYKAFCLLGLITPAIPAATRSAPGCSVFVA